MSLSRGLRATLVVAVLGLAPVLSACSFQPVYSGRLAEQSTMDIAFAKPATRLEQIIYQDLAFRLGRSDSSTAPLASVTVQTSVSEAFLSATNNPSKLYEANISAQLTITPRDGNGGQPIIITRSAKAQYTRNGQLLADQSAEIDAQERAAKSVAESLRLGVLAALSR